MFGLRVGSLPHKFIIHAPQLRGDYPTREGLGLQLCEWFVLKRVGARMGAQYLERWGKPFMDITFSTGDDDKPRAADKPDIERAVAASGAIGAGSMSGWVHPDSVQVNAKSHDAGKKAVTFPEWIELCNGEISKPVLGNTLTTEVGSTGGNRALGQVHGDEEAKILAYDAQAMCDTLDEQLIASLVRLNYGADAMKLAPHVRLHVTDPDPAALLALGIDAAKGNIAVDGDALAEEIGLKTVPNKTGAPRRMYPLAGITDLLPMVDPDIQQKAEEAADADAERQAKVEAAKPPPVVHPGMPGQPGQPGAVKPPGAAQAPKVPGTPPKVAKPVAKPPTAKAPAKKPATKMSQAELLNSSAEPAVEDERDPGVTEPPTPIEDAAQ